MSQTWSLNSHGLESRLTQFLFLSWLSLMMKANYPPSCKTMPSAYMYALGINGKSFYFYIYCFTCLEKWEYEDSVLYVIQSFKNKGTLLQKHDNKENTIGTFSTLSFINSSMRKKMYQRGKNVRVSVPLIFFFSFLHKTGPFSTIVSDINSNRYIWNFLPYLELIFSSWSFQLFCR